MAADRSTHQRSMASVVGVLRREHDQLDHLAFRFLEVRLLLAAAELGYLRSATGEVEEARRRVCETDLLRAAGLHRMGVKGAGGGTPTLREVAAAATEPWAGMLRDHHEALCTVVSEIEVIGHRNAELAREGIGALAKGIGCGLVGRACTPGASSGRADVDALAAEGAYADVIGTAGRLRMPALLAFLR